MSYTNYNYDFRRNKLAEPAQLTSYANLWTPTVDQKHMLGCVFETNQGDKYRYCKNGTTALAKAVLVASEAIDAQQVGQVQTAYGVSAGEVTFQILCTTGNGISNDELIDGYLLVNDGGATMGDSYVIRKNKWITSDTVMEVTIADAGGLRNAIAATDDVSYFKNRFLDVIVKPTTLTSPIVGATTTIVPASYYFWAKAYGVTAILTDVDGDVLVAGEPAGHDDTVGAEGTIGLAGTHAEDIVLGTAWFVSTDDECALINLDIPGI